MPSSDAGDAKIASLSGPELVERLRTSYRSEDYKAAARVLAARDGALAMAEAKERLGARDRKLAEAKEGLDARDRKLTEVEAALAEAKEGLAARDRKLAEMESELAEAKERDRRFTRMQDLTTALAQVAAMGDAAPHGGPRGEEARPGGAIAAPVPAQCGERRPQVVQEKGPDIIDLCSSDEEDPKGSHVVSRKRKAAASEVSEEGRRAIVSRKGNAAASPCASDDEDDALTLSQLMKKKRGEAEPGADGEPKNADSVRALGTQPEVSLVIKEEAMEATSGACEVQNVATFLQGRGNVSSGEDLGPISSEIPSPQVLCCASAVGNNSLKNPSRANSAGSLGSELLEMSVMIKKEAIEATIGGPGEPKVANFLQDRGNDTSVKNVSVPKGPPPGFPATSSQKNFSKVNDAGARIVAKEGSLGIVLPKTPVIMERPEIKLGGYEESEVADNGVVSRVLLSSVPPGFAPMDRSQKNIFKPDRGGSRIAGEDNSLAGQSQHSWESLSARKIVESVRAGAMSPIADNMVLGLEAIGEQKKTNCGVQNAKVLPGTEAIEEQVRRGMVLRATGEQDETKGLEHRRNVMHDGPLQTSDKQLGSATLLLKIEPHTWATSVEGSLPPEVTRKWKYETDVFSSLIQNKELCMQAACALYRQKKLMIQQTEGGQSGSSRLCKSDAHRANKLVEFLLDGNVQGPLKRTVEELVKHDSAGLSFLENLVHHFHEQLFCIYKNKEDPYFC